MEVEQEKKVWHSVNITGNWKLDYRVDNNMGPTAFGGKHIGIYQNPFNMTKTYLKGVNGEALSGYIINKITQRLYPDKNPDEYNLISWLICHPEIVIKGVKNLDQQILDSKTGNKITLTCLDYVEIQEIDKEDFIDRINGRLSLDGGPKAIGLEKIRYVLAQLGLSYMEARFEGKGEKKFLRSKLKTFVRKSYANAKRADKAINDIQGSKDYFEFKEMIRLKILVLSNGLYKFNETPIGATYDSVRVFYENHPEVEMETTKQLYALIK